MTFMADTQSSNWAEEEEALQFPRIFVSHHPTPGEGGLNCPVPAHPGFSGKGLLSAHSSALDSQPPRKGQSVAAASAATPSKARPDLQPRLGRGAPVRVHLRGTFPSPEENPSKSPRPTEGNAEDNKGRHKPSSSRRKHGFFKHPQPTGSSQMLSHKPQ